MSKILIKNGTIVDGTGINKYKADLLINNNTIEKIGRINETSQNFNRVIDAIGMVVCPGFIDTHSHSDLEILLNPYVEPKIRQGITTEILGQDGISMAPLPLKYVSAWRKTLAGFEGDSDKLSWDWENTDGYLKLLEKLGVGPNVAYLVPHGNIRMEAMGLQNKKANGEDIKKMKEITKREMEAGAAGLSTGLIYMPCAYGDTEEIIEICKAVAEYDRIFVVHQRSEADTILDSMEEVINIGRESGVKIHYSHFKDCGKKNWDKVDKVVELLEKAKAEGISVSFDQYPYVAGSTILGVILPPWVHYGGTENLVKRLANKKLRKKMVNDIENGIPGWDNFIDFAGFDNIYVNRVNTIKNKDCIGKSLTEIGEMRSKDKYDAVFDLLYEERNAVGMYDYYGKEDNVIKFMKRPEQNVCTDGLLGGKPHPRVYGAFARVLGKYVREEKTLTLEEAICKMTSKPSEVFKLNDRGVLKESKKADIVILNPDTIIDTATFIEPAQYPIGIINVIINGEVVLDNGQRLKAVTGNVMRIK